MQWSCHAPLAPGESDLSLAARTAPTPSESPPILTETRSVPHCGVTWELPRSFEHTPLQTSRHWLLTPKIELLLGPSSKSRQAGIANALGDASYVEISPPSILLMKSEREMVAPGPAATRSLLRKPSSARYWSTSCSVRAPGVKKVSNSGLLKKRSGLFANENPRFVIHTVPHSWRRGPW